MGPPLLVTTAIIKDFEKILLVKRAREPYKDFWSFVGGCGAFEEVSNPKAAVKREVYADLRCDFEPDFFTYSFNEFNFNTSQTPVVNLFFYGDKKGSIKINPEYVQEYAWFSRKQTEGMELGFDHGPILKEFWEKFFGLLK